MKEQFYPQWKERLGYICMETDKTDFYLDDAEHFISKSPVKEFIGTFEKKNIQQPPSSPAQTKASEIYHLLLTNED